MRTLFNALPIGIRFASGGMYYIKVSQHTAKNLHTDLYVNFEPDEVVLFLGE